MGRHRRSSLRPTAGCLSLRGRGVSTAWEGRGRGVSTFWEGLQYGVGAVFCLCQGTRICLCLGTCFSLVSLSTVLGKLLASNPANSKTKKLIYVNLWSGVAVHMPHM